MRRWIFRLIAMVSLVLCIASLLLIVRARRSTDQLRLQVGQSLLWVRSNSDGIHVLRKSEAYQNGVFHLISGRMQDDYLWDLETKYAENSVQWLGFALFTGNNYGPGPRPYWLIVAPQWVLFVVTAALPLRWAVLGYRAQRKRWRRKRGLCAGCGYDLRATPELCPECGAKTLPLTNGARPRPSCRGVLDC